MAFHKTYTLNQNIISPNVEAYLRWGGWKFTEGYLIYFLNNHLILTVSVADTTETIMYNGMHFFSWKRTTIHH